MVISEASGRTKEAKDSLQSIKKILNGGGSLSAELLKDAIQIFPRSKIVSAYGELLSSSLDNIDRSDVLSPRKIVNFRSLSRILFLSTDNYVTL